MTVAASTALSSYRLEYILAIEGVGWLSDEADYSQGFDGDVFVTNDFDGTLASDLGCTIHQGLTIPGTITERFNPLSMDYSVGGLSFEVRDFDDWFAANYVPHKAGVETTLNGDHDYFETTITMTSAAGYNTGGLAWLGGRELVLLGTKSGSQFTGSTRGYLGTPIGSNAYAPMAGTANQGWADGTTVFDVHRFWRNRNVALYAHVPGEVVDNVYLLWFGKLTRLAADQSGKVWNIEAAGKAFRVTGRKFRHGHWTVNRAAQRKGNLQTTVDTAGVVYSSADADPLQTRLAYMDIEPQRAPNDMGEGTDHEKYRLPAFFHYRWEAGGTAGMKTTWDSGDVQAPTLSSGEVNGDVVDAVGAFMKVGTETYWVRKRSDHWDGTTLEQGKFRMLACDLWSWDRGAQAPPTEDAPVPGQGQDVRFLLDNFPDNHMINRYTVDKTVRRNVIDVFLCHLLTMNDEYWLGNSSGTPTATVIPCGTPGWTTNQWAGYAFFSITDSNTKYEARVIVSNTTTTITVSPGFSAAPAAGEEFQIRNSIYDVLPLGWGLGMHHSKVDIAEFETLRDEFLSDAETGKFMLGMEDIDLLELLQDNLLAPYGILIYTDRDSHKLKPRYVGIPFTDGVLESYTAIAASDFLTKPEQSGALDGIGGFEVQVRSNEERAMHVVSGNTFVKNGKYTVQLREKNAVDTPVMASVPFSMKGPMTKIIVRSEEVENAYDEEDLDLVEVPAIFNTDGVDCAALIARLKGMLTLYTIPPLKVSFRLAAKHITAIQIGEILSMTLPTWPYNPFTGTRGWANVIGRVLELRLLGDNGPGLEVGVELLQEMKGGRYAPAAYTAAYGGPDAGGNYYIDMQTSETFVWDVVADKDWYHFAVNDKIEIRNADGSLEKGGFTIQGFGGATQAASQSTPTGATPARIWVGTTDPTTVTWQTNDYVTFSAFAVGQPSNMDNYFVHADSVSLMIGAGSVDPYKLG